MDLQLFLTLSMISFSAAIAFVMVLNRAEGAASFVLVNLLVIATGIWSLSQSETGLSPAALTAAVFLPFVVGPLVFMRLAQRYSAMYRWREAARASRIAAMLHPAPHMLFQARLTAAIAEAEETGRFSALEQLAARSRPPRDLLVTSLILTRQDRWAELLTAIDAARASGPDIDTLRLRALGETGRIEDMAIAYEQGCEAMPGPHRAQCQLFVLAFTGARAAVDRLLENHLVSLAEETKAYWRAVATLNSAPLATVTGQGAPVPPVLPQHAGEGPLAALAASASRPATRTAAARHLADGAPAAIPLRAVRLAQRIAARTADEAADFHRARRPIYALPVTLFLILANLAGYGLELLADGTEDLDVLVALGALWPPLVVEAGEWWRLLTATFLHYGPVHLFANMLVLFLLGRIVEHGFGAARMLAIYLVSGVTSSAAVLAMMLIDPLASGVLVGASGAIFGLIGAETARQLRAWLASRDAADRRQLIFLGFIMVLQTAVDLSVPQVSLTAHLSGFLAGFLLGLPLAPRRRLA